MILYNISMRVILHVNKLKLSDINEMPKPLPARKQGNLDWIQFCLLPKICINLGLQCPGSEVTVVPEIVSTSEQSSRMNLYI